MISKGQIPGPLSLIVPEVVLTVLFIAFVLRACFKMETVTAISLACNAIQVVEVSYKIVREARELYTGAVGASARIHDLGNVTADLQDVSGRLNRQLRRPDVDDEWPSTSDGVSEKTYVPEGLSMQLRDDVALRTLCEQCATTAEDLADTLKGYKVGRKGFRKRDRIPESLEVAVRTHFKAGELEELNDRLRNYREQLVLRLLVYTREEVNLGRLEQLEKLQSLSRDTKEIIDQGPQTKRFIQNTTETQTQVLNNILSSYFDKVLQRLEAVTLPADAGRPAGGPGVSVWSDAHDAAKERIQSVTIFDAVEAGQVSDVRAIVERDAQALFAAEKGKGMTALHVACQAGNRDVCLFLMRSGARLNTYDNEGKVPLHHATIADVGAMVRVLVEKGADIDARDNSGATPADYARRGSEAEWIFKWGAWLNAQNDRQETALYHFAERDDIGTVRSLLDQRADPNARGRDRVTPLIMAAEKGRIQIMDILISRGASVESRNKRNDTAIIRAARSGQVSAVRELLDHGADVEAHNDEDYTPLNEAAWHGHTEVVKLLLSRGADGQHQSSRVGYRPIQQAAQRGHLEIVKACLAEGVPVDSTSVWGWTALHEASRHDHPSITELCLSRGADPNKRTDNKERTTALYEAAQDNHLGPLRLLLADPRTDPAIADHKGWTPLHRAAQRGHVESVAALLQAGAPVNVEDQEKRHPLLLAALHGHVAVVTRLLAAGADVEHRKSNGSPALVEAACGGHAAVVKFLIQAGANVEARTHRGYTALTEACRAGSEETVRILLDGYRPPGAAHPVSCADIEHRGADGWSALIEASHWGRKSCVRLLLDRGARLDWTTNRGADAVDLAAEKGHSEIVEMLRREAGIRAMGKQNA